MSRRDVIMHRCTWTHAFVALAVAAAAWFTGVVSAAGRDIAMEPVRVMTFNIRYGTAPDGENSWLLRRELVVKVIRAFNPDVVGLQEALAEQLEYLAESLPQFAQAGVGREADGGGEYSAILYRRVRFDLHATDTFWLSGSPEAPGSKSWGNQLPRICTWVRLADRDSQQRFYLYNTHWDHQSQPSRVESAKLIARRIAERVGAGEPVIVTGDFNAAEDNPAMAALVGRETGLRDAYRDLHVGRSGSGTFHGFRGEAGDDKIDAVLISPWWSTVEAAIDRTSANSRYPSDHFPVTAIVRRGSE